MIQKIVLKCFCLITFLCLTPFTESRAQNYLELANLSPQTHYLTFDTEHFHFIYQEGFFDFTKRAAGHFEHAHEVLSPILKWQPRAKTDILIADNEDAANGFTAPALRVGIVLIPTPPDAWFSTSYTDDWIKLLVFHEYTHFLNIDPTTKWMEGLRLFFGDVIRPNGLWPIWMLEGLAVYFETRTSLLGRGRSPYYESILRAYVNENRLGMRENRGMTLDRVNGDYPYFPGGETPYLFGYHLWNQFSKDHSLQTDTDSAMGEYSIRSSHRVPYFIEGNLEAVMKKKWLDYWNSFVEESNLRFSAEIAAVKKSGETPSTLITKAGYSANAGVISPDGKYLAYTESSMTERSSLALIELDTGKKIYLEQKIMGIGMSFTPDSRFLIYSSFEKVDSYQFFSDLFSYDVVNHKNSRLTVGMRAKDPSVSSDGRNITFIKSIHASHQLMSAPITVNGEKISIGEVRVIYAAPEYSILGSPKFMSNHEVIFSSQEIGKAQSDLKIADLDGAHSRILLSDGAMNRFPTLDEGRIHFVSDRTGIENIYSISSNGKNQKQVSNVVTGVEFPFFSSAHELYGSLMTSDGFEIAKFSPDQVTVASTNNKKVAFPSAPETIKAAMSEPSLAITENQSIPYSPWSSLRPRAWNPIAYLAYGTYSGLSIGGLLLGFDSTGKQQYVGNTSYHFKTQTLDGGLNYTLYYFRPLIRISAATDTTDIATDAGRSQYRRTSEVSLGLSYPFFFTHSTLKPSVYGFVDWTRIYDLAARTPIYSSNFEYANPLVPGVGASIAFSDAERSKLAFMPEHGNNVILSAEDRVNTKQFSVIKYLAAHSHYFDFGNSSVLVTTEKWLSSSHPTGLDRSYARLEGKHTNDSTDTGQTLSLNRIGIRGYSDSSYFGKAAGVGSLDFHFPIAHTYFGLGSTEPFFLKQIHGFVFVEGAYLPNNYLGNPILPSFGGGATLDTLLFIRAPLSFSLQLQNGTRKDLGGDTQAFLSISAGSLF